MTLDRASQNTHDHAAHYPADMAHVALQLRIIEDEGPRDVELRRWKLLRRLNDKLGPVQWEHLTDHCQRVSVMTQHIAEVMQLPSDDVERVRTAGLLHDIGKCMIPEGLLAKPSRLSAEEWCLMERHEAYGVWIARRIGADRTTSRYIQLHHRRFDAVPAHSVGGATTQPADDEPVPIGAAILCAADALVTMLSERPYCRSRSVASSLNELQMQRGRQFHPDVIDAAAGAETVARRLAA